MHRLLGMKIATCLFLIGTSNLFGQELPKMKFNDVREIAPGVFFRFSSISATDKSVVFGGCNNIWVVFKDYVLVYDANFPKEAGDVIEAIRKTTKKPIKYVIDSHHHGDHAYGNAIWAKEGASIIAHSGCVNWLKTKGEKEFAEAGKGPTGRKDIANSFLKIPDIVFEDRFVLDDGTQRAEIIFLGHCHTPGDTALYLPKHKIICTGDACVNGAYNYMGHSNSAAWIKNLEKAQQFDIKIICPGHGPLAHKDLLGTQRKWFVELREQVQKGIDAGKEVEDIIKTIDIPWYKDWTGAEARDQIPNIKHVYDELTGRTLDWELTEDFGIYEGPSPTKEDAGWAKPKRIVVPKLMPAELNQLKKIAPDVMFVPVKNAAEASKEAGDADAVLGFGTIDVLENGKKLRWVQLDYSGLDAKAKSALKGRKVTITDVRHIHGTDVSEQAFALLLALSRGVQTGTPKLLSLPKPGIVDPNKKAHQWVTMTKPKQLHGKTMLVVGLGGVGRQIAKRADAFGMRVLAIDSNPNQDRPNFVFSISGPDKLTELLPKADVVVLASPLSAKTKDMIGKEQFQTMKQSAYLINVARSGLINTEALVDALKNKKIAGVGLDVTDPTLLPNDHPLWKMPNVVISPKAGGMSSEARTQQWQFWRENVRRFVNGERLLGVME